MKLTFKCCESLPRLAWCAKATGAHDAVEVLHGPWVETAGNFFCEGAWNGDFASGEIDTGILMGSGGRIVGDTVVLASPNHTMERLFVLRRRNMLLVSNSLIFLLASAHDNVDPHALLYSVKLNSISNGLKGYSRWLPTRNGNRVRMYYHCNLRVDPRLRVTEEPKKAAPDFVNFADYQSFLLEQVRAIHANANDSRRAITYQPITSISSGYDSATAAVLARTVGCTEALTFSQARGGNLATNELDDSGAAIAARLGMQTHVFDRLEYLKQKGFPEAEFYGWGAQESPWAKHLEARILFTGHHGDRVWGKHIRNRKVNPYIERPGGPSGHNLDPFRLRVGWIHLPIPFLGCTRHESIHRISNSPEMEPWSLNNKYDRPISRRLIEEAGVERHLFGMKKRAAGPDLGSEGLIETMTKESLDDYKQYYQKRWNTWMSIKQRVFVFVKQFHLAYDAYSLLLTERLEDKTGIRIQFPCLIPREIRIGNFGNLDNLSLLVHWSIEKLLPNYAVNSSVQSQQHRVSANITEADDQTRRTRGSAGLPPAISAS
jgi:hypothetical protein